MKVAVEIGDPNNINAVISEIIAVPKKYDRNTVDGPLQTID